MGAPYTSQSAPSTYNQNPPADDGSQVASNRAEWAKHINKIGAPLKSFVEGVNTDLLSAFGKVIGGGGVTSAASPYTIQASDQGKLVRLTSAGTVTTATAATVSSPFVHGIFNDSSGNVTFDGAGSETVNGQSSVAIQPDQGGMVYTDGSNWFIVGIGGTLPRGYLSGMQLSNNGTDAAHDIDITAGECRGADDDEDITLSAITKQIDATWAAGTNAGGLSSSLTAPANATWYHVFAIIVGGVADVGFDTSVTATNLVTDHSATAYRRLGSVLTDGSANILGFTQDGDDFWWDDPPLDVNVINLGTTAVLYTLSTPLGVSTKALLNTATDDNGGSANSVYLSTPDANDEAPSQSAAPLASVGMASSTDAIAVGGGIPVRTNLSSEIRARSDVANSDLLIATLAYTDTRGRND